MPFSLWLLKWLGIFTFVYFLAYQYFLHDFVSSPWGRSTATKLAWTVASFALAAFLIHLCKTDSGGRCGWDRCTKFEKFSILFFKPLVVYAIFYVILDPLLFRLATSLYGTVEYMPDFVQAQEGRLKETCRRKLSVRSIESSGDSTFFSYCLSHAEYDRFGKDVHPATLKITKSDFGFVVEDIKIKDDRAE